MSLLGKLFGKKKSPEELREEAKARLDAIDALVMASPQKAARGLGGFDGTQLEPLVDFGAELHEPFAERVLTVLGAAERARGSADGALKPSDLPPVSVYSDPEPTAWEAIVAAADKEPNGVSYIRYTRNFTGHEAVYPALLGLAMMTRDPRIQAAFIGDGYALVRNPFLVALAEHWPSQVSEKQWEREFDDIATGKLGCEECDGEFDALGVEHMVYRAAN
jgi:hypothetical protein